jgi:hypothetical protein
LYCGNVAEVFSYIVETCLKMYCFIDVNLGYCILSYLYKYTLIMCCTFWISQNYEHLYICFPYPCTSVSELWSCDYTLFIPPYSTHIEDSTTFVGIVM